MTNLNLTTRALHLEIRWSGSLLAVVRLDPPRRFVIGETARADYAVPAELLGCAEHALVEVDGGLRVVAPAGAREEAIDGGAAVTVGALRFEVRAAEAEKRMSAPLGLNRAFAAALGASAAFVLGTLGATALMMPELATNDDDVTIEQRYDMQRYLDSAAEREEAAKPGDKTQAGSDERGDKTAERGPERHERSFGPGHSSGGNPGGSHGHGEPLSREEAIADARHFGLAGIAQDGDLPAFPGGDAPVAGDGTLWNGTLRPGSDLDLSNHGYGSDVPGGGDMPITIDTSPNGGQFSMLRPRPRREHHAEAPELVNADPKTGGPGLPIEVVQRTVRMSFGRFRACYDGSSIANSGIGGHVRVRFVVGRDGTVISAGDAGSDLPDKGVVACVVGSFRGLEFPAPERAATFTYPILFVPPSA